MQGLILYFAESELGIQIIGRMSLRAWIKKENGVSIEYGISTDRLYGPLYAAKCVSNVSQVYIHFFRHRKKVKPKCWGITIKLEKIIILTQV